MTYEIFYQPKGGAPSKVASHSHYNEPIPNDGQPHGNSRRHGDASPEVQAKVVQAIIDETKRAGLSREDAAHILAIARIESGFNPDAAAGETSASGVGQFIDKTGAGYGLSDRNRFNLQENVRALVEHYVDNKQLAMSNGKDSTWVYKYHHDGPVQNSGGLTLARNEVAPYVKAYMASEALAGIPEKGSDAFYRMDGGGRQIFPGGGSDASGLRNLAQAGARDFAEQTSQLAGKLNRHQAAVKSHFNELGVKDLTTVRPQFLESSSGTAESQLNKSSPAQFDVLPTRITPVVDDSVYKGASVSSPQPAAEVSPRVTLEQALAAHMEEKGFDAGSLARAPDLARQLESLSGANEPAAALVLHKEGDALASLVGRTDAQAFAQQGDSVLALDKLERVAREGLDTDAVATLRGLAPERTQPFSDLEVYQGAPAALYSAAKDPTAPLGSAEQAKELLAGLSTAGGVLNQELAQGRDESRRTEVREAAQMAEMAMSA